MLFQHCWAPQQACMHACCADSRAQACPWTPVPSSASRQSLPHLAVGTHSMRGLHVTWPGEKLWESPKGSVGGYMHANNTLPCAARRRTASPSTRSATSSWATYSARCGPSATPPCAWSAAASSSASARSSPPWCAPVLANPAAAINRLPRQDAPAAPSPSDPTPSALPRKLLLLLHRGFC